MNVEHKIAIGFGTWRGHIIPAYNKYKFTKRVGNSDFHSVPVPFIYATANPTHSAHWRYINIGWLSCEFVCSNLLVYALLPNTIALGYEITSFAYLLFCRSYLLYIFTIFCLQRIGPNSTYREKNGSAKKKRTEEMASVSKMILFGISIYGYGTWTLNHICSFFIFARNWENDLVRFEFEIHSFFLISLWLPYHQIFLWKSRVNGTKVDLFYNLSFNWLQIKLPSITNQHQLIPKSSKYFR